MLKIKTEKVITAEEALAPIKSGQRVLVGSGAAEPQHLVRALAAKGSQLSDTEVLHLLTLGAAPYSSPKFEGRLRHNALFIGPNVREAVSKGMADYTPCFLSEIPSLFRSGRLPLDAALIQVTPPDREGLCSLGVSVDILKAAVETAPTVVAQINPHMPWTEGDSCVALEELDSLVPFEEPLLQLPQSARSQEALRIGLYISHLVENGSTLQMGIGSIPNAALAALTGKKDLGIHSEMISDGILSLMEKGIVTGRKKTLHPGKIVTSFCLGTNRLYQAVDKNPLFEFRPSDYVNSPSVIARNDRMVSINSALGIDLTGQVAADSLGHRFYSGVGGQVDFIRGAALSRSGRSIIALPSTAMGGTVSRIVPFLEPGTGVVTTRADIDFVVTEYGIASLKGKSIRERAIALIQIAHPEHRKFLISEAKRTGYLDPGHILPAEAEPYLVELEARKRFGKKEVFFRPMKPSDEKRLKELFYSQSQQTTYLRFGQLLKTLGERRFQKLVSVDYRHSLAIAGFVREEGRERMIAVARCYGGAGEGLAEAAFTVHDDYQGLGIGTFLVDYLAWIAKERGLKGFVAQTLKANTRMIHVLKKCFCRVEEQKESGETIAIAWFSDWKGKENPAHSHG